MEFKSYHKIRQFRDVIRDISFKANYKGKDENDQPIYEETEKPVITFSGKVKIHGTNAGIVYNPEDGMLAQKRSSILDKENLSSHFNFNAFLNAEESDALKNLLARIWNENCSGDDQITLYGEWAGSNIQKGVGVTELPKMFFFFDCKCYNKETGVERWINVEKYHSTSERIWNINVFPNWEVPIDFNNPAEVQNHLIKLTEEVEKECPVAKYFGKSGIGEGIVWTAFWNGDKFIFKVKGEKHSTTKVKKLASVDPELVKSIQEFVDYACTDNRIEQGIQETDASEKKDMPNLLRWVANDIISEESDVLTSNNLEWKQVARECSNRVRQHFFAKLNTI